MYLENCCKWGDCLAISVNVTVFGKLLQMQKLLSKQKNFKFRFLKTVKHFAEHKFSMI